MEKRALQSSLDSLSFSCGAHLQDANIPEQLINTVYVCELECHEPIEKLQSLLIFVSIVLEM